MTQTIAFGYPRRGLSGQFNTFRLGPRFAQRCPPGTEVELVDARTKRVLKRATVTAVFTGPLAEMASAHAHQAHNWKEYPESERQHLLVASLKKRYPPGRARDDSVVSVIYMQEQYEQRREEGK